MTPDGAGARAAAEAILAAAVAAVRPERLIPQRLVVAAGRVGVAGDGSPKPVTGRVAIVGGGKAAAGMAAAVADLLARGGFAGDRVTGLVSVPEGCDRRLDGIEVRGTRPAAENLPTPAVVTATREMLGRVASLGPADLAIAVISGGGSALMAAPRAGVPLEEKIAVARFLSAAGADIREINAVRRAASDVKGGGLARACAAGRMLVLVLSDVIGDPLEIIASGPCLPASGGAAEALAVLERHGGIAAGVAPRLVALLREDVRRAPAGAGPGAVSARGSWTTDRGCRVEHLLLGGNATAVAAAAAAAERLGYAVMAHRAAAAPGETADEAGRRLAREGLALAAASARDGRPRAIVEGGEAVVRLPEQHGVGGRNQQTVAAALVELLGASEGWPEGLVIASLGTDGEDGPTQAAGGIADATVAGRLGRLGLEAAAAVARCDALPVLAAAGGLVVTGPTGTNVADVRVVLARGGPAASR